MSMVASPTPSGVSAAKAPRKITMGHIKIPSPKITFNTMIKVDLRGLDAGIAAVSI
jgi:hypothetical protein